MFFGLTNSPATFQTMMNDIFADMISEGVVVVYLDDILIFTKDLEEHRKITRRVLQRLAESFSRNAEAHPTLPTGGMGSK